MPKPIYPVQVKPRTAISRWSQWPEDCVDEIRRLVRGWYSTGGVFKCADCEAFCEPHPHGVPHVSGPGWKGTHGYPLLAAERHLKADVLCDECLIARARAALAFRETNAPKET